MVKQGMRLYSIANGMKGRGGFEHAFSGNSVWKARENPGGIFVEIEWVVMKILQQDRGEVLIFTHNFF